MKALILSLLLAVTAEAQTVRATITWAGGPNGISYASAKEVASWLGERYRIDFGIILQYRVRAMRDLSARYNGLDDSQRQLKLWRWQKFFSRQNTSPDIIQLIITPPMWDNDRYWIAGMANGLCTLHKYRGVATADAEYFNSDGLPRFLQSEYTVYHESAHLLGAKHITSPVGTLMDPAATYYVQPYQYLPIAPVTKQQIWKCLH